MDATTADAAMQMAIAAIDANAFSRISIGDERQARLRPNAIESRQRASHRVATLSS
jgi:hypothetical protein